MQNSQRVTLLWFSPWFENEYERLRPGVRIPDMYKVKESVEQVYGEVTKRFVVVGTESPLSTNTVTKQGFHPVNPSQVPALTLTDTVVVLGADPDKIAALLHKGIVVAGFDVSLLTFPTPELAPYDELLAQVCEIGQALGETVRSKTLRAHLEMSLVNLHDRCSKEGKTYDAMLKDSADRGGWTVGARSVRTKRASMQRGAVIQIGSSGVDGVVIDSGVGSAMCLVGNDLRKVGYGHMSSTGETLGPDALLERLIAAVLNKNKVLEGAEPSASMLGRLFTSAGTRDSDTTAVLAVVEDKSPSKLSLVEVHPLRTFAASSLFIKKTSSDFIEHLEAPPQPVRRVTADVLDPSLAYVGYQSRDSLMCPYLFVWHNGEWKPHAVIGTESDNVIPFSVGGTQVSLVTVKGARFNAFVAKTPLRRSLDKPLVVFGDPIDEPWLQVLRDSHATPQAPSLPDVFALGDVVTARYGERNKKDTLIVVAVETELVGVMVAPGERSHVALVAPKKVGSSTGAGLRFTRVVFERERIEKFIGQCSGEDLETINEYIAWSAGCAEFRPGRVLLVKRPGEEGRNARPSVVMSCSSDRSSVTVRAMTSSPLRDRDSGHELLHPDALGPGSKPGKVRDVEFTVGITNVTAMLDILDPEDFTMVSSQRARLRDVYQRKK